MKIFNDSNEFHLYILEQKLLVPEMTVLEHIAGYVEKLNQINDTDYQVDDLKHLINHDLKQVIEKELRIR